MGLVVVVSLVLLSLAYHQGHDNQSQLKKQDKQLRELVKQQTQENNKTKQLLRSDFCDFLTGLLHASQPSPPTRRSQQLRQKYIVMYKRIGCGDDSTGGGPGA